MRLSRPHAIAVGANEPGLVALVGVDVRREEQGEVAHVGQLSRDEGPADVAHAELVVGVVGHHQAAVRPAERQVDVAGVALALVELRHEGQRACRPGRRSPWRRSCRSTWLSQVASASVYLKAISCWPRLHSPLADSTRQAGAGHVVADAAQQRLDPGGTEHRVVDVVEVRRREVAVAGLPGLLVGVAEDDELELGADEGPHAGVGEAGQLAAQDLARRRDHVAAVLPVQVGQEGRRCPAATGPAAGSPGPASSTKSP